MLVPDMQLLWIKDTRFMYNCGLLATAFPFVLMPTWFRYQVQPDVSYTGTVPLWE